MVRIVCELCGIVFNVIVRIRQRRHRLRQRRGGVPPVDVIAVVVSVNRHRCQTLATSDFD
jgi:hypothetical protein